MSHLTPTVQRRNTQRADGFDWRYEHRAFRFQVKGFFVSFRREPQRHGEFWYAYKRIDGNLYKHYVGRSEDLTYDHLLEIVEQFRYW